MHRLAVPHGTRRPLLGCGEFSVSSTIISPNFRLIIHFHRNISNLMPAPLVLLLILCCPFSVQSATTDFLVSFVAESKTVFLERASDGFSPNTFEALGKVISGTVCGSTIYYLTSDPLVVTVDVNNNFAQTKHSVENKGRSIALTRDCSTMVIGYWNGERFPCSSFSSTQVLLLFTAPTSTTSHRAGSPMALAMCSVLHSTHLRALLCQRHRPLKRGASGTSGTSLTVYHLVRSG
jgi:hypothetical protein